jgi:hypothetical protein
LGNSLRRFSPPRLPGAEGFGIWRKNHIGNCNFSSDCLQCAVFSPEERNAGGGKAKPPNLSEASICLPSSSEKRCPAAT